jgi:hypothetical protein
MCRFSHLHLSRCEHVVAEIISVVGGHQHKRVVQLAKLLLRREKLISYLFSSAFPMFVCPEPVLAKDRGLNNVYGNGAQNGIH